MRESLMQVPRSVDRQADSARCNDEWNLHVTVGRDKCLSNFQRDGA